MSKTKSDIVKDSAKRLGLTYKNLPLVKPDPEDFMEFPLPEWAIGLARGEFVLGAHLPTRDGRRHGNGHIIKIEPASWDTSVSIHTVLTDAGSEMRMTASELAECFYPPQWVSNVDEVKRKFAIPDPAQAPTPLGGKPTKDLSLCRCEVRTPSGPDCGCGFGQCAKGLVNSYLGPIPTSPR